MILLLLSGCLYDHDQYLLYLSYLHDDDGDGYSEIEEDCKDANPDINPGETEYCNGVDDDCDGRIDSNAVDIHIWYQDLDGDGWGNEDVSRYDCTQPVLHTDKKGDCDDEDPTSYPDALEACDATKDNNCDGFFGDIDEDGVGPCTDCNNYNASIYPGAPEICNGNDDDCDGVVDNADEVDQYWYLDQDNDGYGIDTNPVQGCTAPAGYVSQNADCNDENAQINPGLGEYCGDDIDQNCDHLPNNCRRLGNRNWDAMLSGGAATVIAAIPDITGDGADELLIASNQDAGSVAMVAQQVRGAVDISALRTSIWTGGFDLAAYGQNIAVGDQNGDNWPDVAVQANEMDGRGRIYLISAGSGNGTADDRAYAILEGPTSDAGTGNALLLLPGDTDEDGQAELVVGDPFVGPGTVYILDHSLSGTTTIASAETIFVGEQSADTTGLSAIPLDENGDGLTDWAIFRFGNSLDRPPGIYIAVGPVTGSYSLADSDILLESVVGDTVAIAPKVEAGDFNGDGADDLVAASTAGEAVDVGGTVIVIEAPFASGPYSTAATFVGESGSNGRGGYLMNHQVIDLDNDGILDIILGAPLLDNTFDGAGRTYAFYGPFGGTIGVGVADCQYDGQAGDILSGSAFAAGDFNGSGSIDLAILEPGYGSTGQVSLHWGWGF